MFNLIVALCAMPGLMTRSMSVSLPIATARSISAAEIPLKVPTGWKSTLNQGATVMTPDDVPEGKVYTVVITPLQVKAGKLDDVYDVGVKMIAEVGTYKALTQLQTAKSEGEWDYKFSIGTVEKDKSGFLAQVMGVKKGDVGGIVIVLTDSIETMQKYSDPFSNMIRTLGGSAKPPQAPEIAKSDGKVDLQYTVPAGWVESKREGATVIEASKDEFYTKYRWTMVVMPSQPLTGSLRENFQEYWKALISDNYESGVAPLPLVAEMSNGYVCAYDADGSAKHKVSGAKPTIVSVYVVAHGDRFVPILGILYGYEKQLENDMKRFIETARIPGSSNAKISTRFTSFFCQNCGAKIRFGSSQRSFFYP